MHWAALALCLTLLGLGGRQARADVTVDFTGSVNFTGYNVSDLKAQATFHEDNTAHTLTITLNNNALINAAIAEIDFNAKNATITASSLTSGTGTTAGQFSSTQAGLTVNIGSSGQRDGFGKFDYALSFGPSSTWLSQGKTVTATVSYTGTISDADLKTLSKNPASLGNQTNILDWKPRIAGTGGTVNTGFGSPGGGPGPQGVPEPSTATIVLGCCGIGFVAARARKRFSTRT
jgi:hypothetical protein